MKIYKKKDGPGLNGIQSTPLGLAAEIAAAPNEAVWIDASNYCKSLNNDSTLFYYNEIDIEFDFIVDLLKRLNFPSLINQEQQQNKAVLRNYFSQEQKYFIGLIYNNSLWKSINGQNVSLDFIQKYQLDRARADQYRKCGYLNLRDDGDIKIEVTNCINEKHPYVCKYSKNLYLIFFIIFENKEKNLTFLF
jgi:hypothetical protein